MKNMKTNRLFIVAMALCLIAGTSVSNAQKSSKAAGKAKTNVTVATQAQPTTGLTSEKINAALDEAYTKFKDVAEGKNADYIKELARVDPKIFGIALVTADGQVYTKGDIASMVSIQSISKAFVWPR